MQIPKLHPRSREPGTPPARPRLLWVKSPPGNSDVQSGYGQLPWKLRTGAPLTQGKLTQGSREHSTEEIKLCLAFKDK